MSEACITFGDLTLGYDGRPAVHHLSGTVRKGSLTTVVGGNGAGKSTLMKSIAGLLKPIALGLWPRRGLLGRHRAEDRKAVSDALSAVGLEGFGRRPIDTLSGGQLQRALFARVLVQDAALILLDEPFNAVDSRTVADLIALIERWHGESRTVMVVVHDLGLVRAHFPEALLLARRPVAWGDARETLSPENLLRARQYQEAWDENAPWCGPDGGHGHAHGHLHTHIRDGGAPRLAGGRGAA